MATTPYTQAMIDALKTAMANGVQSVTYEGGKTVHYRSIAEMQSVLSVMQREINAANGVTNSRQIRIRSSRGLEGPVRSWFGDLLPWFRSE